MPHEIEIHYAGAVISNAGNDVYYVDRAAPGIPGTGADLASYDLTFRYPKTLTVAATGKPVEDRTDGDWRVTRVKTDTTVRFAGFNLGYFQSAVVERNGYIISLYANRRLESALAPKALPAPLTVPLDQFRPAATQPGGRFCSARPIARSHASHRKPDQGRDRDAQFHDGRIRPRAHPQHRHYAHSRRIRPRLPGPGLSFDAGISRSGPASSADPRARPRRPSFPTFWKPTKWRTNGGAIWWCRRAITMNGSLNP